MKRKYKGSLRIAPLREEFEEIKKWIEIHGDKWNEYPILSESLPPLRLPYLAKEARGYGFERFYQQIYNYAHKETLLYNWNWRYFNCLRPKEKEEKRRKRNITKWGKREWQLEKLRRSRRKDRN